MRAAILTRVAGLGKNVVLLFGFRRVNLGIGPQPVQLLRKKPRFALPPKVWCWMIS
jgi:hypothetical protein